MYISQYKFFVIIFITKTEINNMLNNVKDTIPRELQSHLEYKFTCARCNSCYIGETCQHFGKLYVQEP